MEKAALENQIDWLQARIEEMDKLIINTDPKTNGYKGAIEAYNKFIDRYNEMITKLENFDKADIEEEKLQLERDKLKINEEIERDKLNLEADKLRLDREKFAYDTQKQKIDDVVDIIFKSADVGTRIAVPIIGGYFALRLALLAYEKNLDLELCDGRIWGLLKQLKV